MGATGSVFLGRQKITKYSRAIKRIPKRKVLNR